jgi:hypothetical protein
LTAPVSPCSRRGKLPFDQQVGKFKTVRWADVNQTR